MSRWCLDSDSDRRLGLGKSSFFGTHGRPWGMRIRLMVFRANQLDFSSEFIIYGNIYENFSMKAG